MINIEHTTLFIVRKISINKCVMSRQWWWCYRAKWSPVTNGASELPPHAPNLPPDALVGGWHAWWASSTLVNPSSPLISPTIARLLVDSSAKANTPPPHPRRNLRSSGPIGHRSEVWKMRSDENRWFDLVFVVEQGKFLAQKNHERINVKMGEGGTSRWVHFWGNCASDQFPWRPSTFHLTPKSGKVKGVVSSCPLKNWATTGQNVKLQKFGARRRADARIWWLRARAGARWGCWPISPKESTKKQGRAGAPRWGMVVFTTFLSSAWRRIKSEYDNIVFFWRAWHVSIGFWYSTVQDELNLYRFSPKYPVPSRLPMGSC